MKNRLLSLLLALVMVLGLCSTAFAAEGVSNFKQVNTYTDGQFTDVPNGQWYAATVKRAYELGLMKGTGNGTTFSPNGNITIAETLALACRLHSTYYGNGTQFVQGSPWYQVYVDYAIANGIIAADDYASYTAKATRADFVTILAASMPASALPAMNTVDDGMIPDIASGAVYYDNAYRMYRAGILTGSDDLGTFRATSNIMRSEVAAIVVRMADASQRKSITLKKPVPQAEKMFTTAALDLYVGQTSQLSYYFTPSDAEKQSVTWSSSNPAVATVSETGLVTAVGTGTATIDIRSEKGLWTSCKVTVSHNPLNDVERLMSASVSRKNSNDGFNLTFQLRSKNGEYLSVPVYVDIEVLNDNLETVYKTTKIMSENDYVRNIMQISINDSEIAPGTNYSGYIYYKIYYPGYYSFEEKSSRVNYLPLKDPTLITPALPQEYSDYVTGGNTVVWSTCQITEVKLVRGSVYSNTGFELMVSGIKTYSKMGSRYVAGTNIRWELYDSKGVLVDSGKMYTASVAVGEHFSSKPLGGMLHITVDVNETYTLKLYNGQ